jgi:alanine dehydrogenase
VSDFNSEKKRQENMKGLIGIRKENIDSSEKRAPLTPEHINELVNRKNIQVIVQPSDNRIFKENDYVKSGAKISEDLSQCNIIFGVKEIPLADFQPKQSYCFFSHTIKGQSHNMPMLKQILFLKNTLLDYEKVLDETGKRLIFFGKYAGYAGMIDTLWALGNRLNWEGIPTPFRDIKYASTYLSLKEAKAAVYEVGKIIKSQGLPEILMPLICGFAGYGQVSQGAQEIFDLLPIKEIKPAQLASIISAKDHSNRFIYKVIFKEEDMVEPITKDLPFSLNHYYQHPEKYQSTFHRYLPYLTLLINGIYWDPRYPKLVTKKNLNQVYTHNKIAKLKVIGDITCDIEGSIECNVKATTSQNPVYVYDPSLDTIKDGWEGDGIVILAVDKLPSEFPKDASSSFGDSLIPFVPALANCNFDEPLDNIGLPVEFREAAIAHHGKLTPNYKYLSKFINPNL